MKRWIWFLIVVVAGVGLGLVYGWVINPVKYVDTTPSTLRIDYKTDYVLMVAEAFQADGDPNLAARRLAIFGDMPPTEIVRQAMIFASQYPYAESDQELLSRLASSLQTWNPSAETPLP